MKKVFVSVLTMYTVSGFFAQEVVWQKDIPSPTQNFLSQVITTIDNQYLVTGSSIRPVPDSQTGENMGYDYHLIKLNQSGEEIWEKHFSGKNHDYLAAIVNTQEGGFLLAGTSWSNKGLDKKEDSKGGSDLWLIRINEFGDELWQKTIGRAADEEARAVVQTTDFGFFVAGNVASGSAPGADKGYGSKDVLVVRLDKNGKEISQLVLGGRGLDEVERMIPTIDGGALLGIYSRSGTVTTKLYNNIINDYKDKN
jgi:hypothetical protein